MLVIIGQSGSQLGILSPLKKEKACSLRKEILIEDIRNKWTEVILYKLFESSQLSRHGIIIVTELVCIIWETICTKSGAE